MHNQKWEKTLYNGELFCWILCKSLSHLQRRMRSQYQWGFVMPVREWQHCWSIHCSGREEWCDHWTHTSKDLFSFFIILSKRWSDEALYYRNKALFSRFTSGRPWGSLLAYILSASTVGIRTCHKFSWVEIFLTAGQPPKSTKISTS